MFVYYAEKRRLQKQIYNPFECYWFLSHLLTNLGCILYIFRSKRGAFKNLISPFIALKALWPVGPTINDTPLLPLGMVR